MIGRRGVTLIELLVTLSILAIISAVTVMAARQIVKPNPADPRTILAESVRVVLATGRAALVHFVVDGVAANAIIRPDGTIVADSLFDIERFTGIPRHAR